MNEGETIAALVAAISVLYGALHLALRQRIEDWKGLYENERKAHIETRTLILEELKENNVVLLEMTRKLGSTSRHKQDWEGKQA
ncbi:MAG: hypothetical protein C4321_01575 [Chloroflexota bacterium]